MRFKIESRDAESHARTGILTLSHGEVETPVFMPVGTAGSVKGMLPSQLEQVGARIILGNTYHLFLRPGLEVIRLCRMAGQYSHGQWGISDFFSPGTFPGG